MAEEQDIEQLKALLGAALQGLTDDQVGALIDASDGDLNKIAADRWGAYASSTATLVTTSESGSSRSLGDIHKNALSLAAYYRSLSKASNPAEIAGRSRTRPIERI